MMGVDQVRPGQRGEKPRRDRVGDVAAAEPAGTEGADAQPAGLAVLIAAPAEGDQLAVDLPRQSAGQLERVALAAAEQAGESKWRGSDVDDAHAGRRLSNSR